MKLLYFSCHSILEYDELKIFEELGIDYFSLGSYVRPTSPVDTIRPPLRSYPESWVIGNAPPRDNIPPEFISQFDTVIIMHVPEWIEENWEKFRGRRVIWRTIGQSTEPIERRMQQYRARGLEIVRYSPREANLEPSAGCDKIIRFYKDPNEFNHWVGGGTEVITFAQDMAHRAEYCNYEAFKQIVEGFNAHVYGPKNEASGELNGGYMSYQDMQQKLRDARVYIYTGTQPASYTLSFIEAMLTGIPIVAIGTAHANSLNKQIGISGDKYEVQDIIQNGVNGFISDDINELRRYTQALVDDVKLARRVGEMGRKTAIALFGKDVIKELWRQYFKI